MNSNISLNELARESKALLARAEQAEKQLASRDEELELQKTKTNSEHQNRLIAEAAHLKRDQDATSWFDRGNRLLADLNELKAELAAKDARIAELGKEIELCKEDC